MRIGDTSALYAAFVAEDTLHEEGRTAVEDSDPILIPSEIFSETMALLQLRFDFDQAQKVGKFIRELPHVRVEGSPNALVRAAWEEYQDAEGDLSLPDAFVVAWCRAESARPLSFDRKLLRRAGDRR